jgi:hypothetical protein
MYINSRIIQTKQKRFFPFFPFSFLFFSFFVNRYDIICINEMKPNFVKDLFVASPAVQRFKDQEQRLVDSVSGKFVGMERHV